jgi:type VI secretion system protein ImpC
MIDQEGTLEAEFTFGRERGNVVEEGPFQILVLGDWAGDSVRKVLSDRPVIEIDRDNFDDVMKRIAPRLTLDQGDAGSIEISFAELDDFHPDRVFGRVPVFERMRSLRKELLSADKFDGAAHEVRSWFNVAETRESQPATQSEKVVSSERLLDSILSGSTAPAPKVEPGRDAELDSLIRDIVRPHIISVDENEQSALLAAVDAAISELMRRILHHAKFKSLEAAWRGLYLLVRRAETSSELRIYIFDATKTELTEDLRSVNDLKDSFLYDLLVRESVDTMGSEPWGLIAGNYGFEAQRDDTAALIRIAKLAAASTAPFVSHIRPDVLGVHSIHGNTDPGKWDLSASSDAGKLWSVLRGIPEATFLGMTIPRFLARLPYGRETDPVETFQFEEFTDAPDHDDLVWSNGAFLAALLMAQSFSEYGWQMDKRFLQDIENLPLYMFGSAGEKIYQPCAEVLITQAAAERLMEHGLMPLISYKNTDHVKLGRFQSIADPVTALRGRWYV